MPRIDLNSDMGEGFGRWSLGDDERMLEVVTSANIACGFHAGDPVVMQRTTREAAAHDVAVGAHPAYRDLAGFGRRAMEVPAAELSADVLYQIAALDGIARSSGTAVTYVKPHGGLYNRIAVDPEQARAVVDAICAYDAGLAVLALAGSVFARVAEKAGLRVVAEAFADRSYLPDSTLVPRSRPGAVLDDPEAVAARTVKLAESGTITATDGSTITIRADSVCVHGDSPNAVRMARTIRERLQREGITVAPFTHPGTPGSGNAPGSSLYAGSRRVAAAGGEHA